MSPLLLIFALAFISAADEQLGNLTNFTTYTRTSGLDLNYLRDIKGAWPADMKIVQKVSETYIDEITFDEMKKTGISYCKNAYIEQWCYITDMDFMNKSCRLPFCVLTDLNIWQALVGFL